MPGVARLSKARSPGKPETPRASAECRFVKLPLLLLIVAGEER
jgi:hypothetical protein